MRGGRPREADTHAHERVREPDLPVRRAFVPQHEHGDEAEQAEDIPEEQGEPRAARLDELRGSGCHDHHRQHGREDRRAGFDGRVVEHVLEELLADEHRAHQRTEHDDPGARGHPEGAACRDVEVVEREPCPSLAEVEADECRERDGTQAERERALAGNRREVDAQHDAGDEHDRQDAAEVVDGVDAFVDVRRHQLDRQHQRDERQRNREQEHRPPPELAEQEPGRERPERRDPPSEG